VHNWVRDLSCTGQTTPANVNSLHFGDSPHSRCVMPITRLLQNASFGPDEIAAMVAAFEGALRELDLTDRTDPATEMVARKIIELHRQGERDPVRLQERVVAALSGKPSSAA
jgi:hypothetical protein